MSISDTAKIFTDCRTELTEHFIGRPEVIDCVLLGLVTGLHVLIEDVPGVGKTTLARSLARIAGLEFGRIQLSPDVLPGDILGMYMYDPLAREFVFRKGAIEHQCILADELNRASERTQSALLEAMQEQQVTIDGITRPLPQPFFLIATQNPSGFAGTFELPEGQLDRFGLSCSIGYPDQQRELAVLNIVGSGSHPEDARPVLNAQLVAQLRKQADAITLSEPVREYIVRLAAATRSQRMLSAGVSPRASGHLLRAARGSALLTGRDYVIPEDVRDQMVRVFQHRLTLSSEARIDQRNLSDVLKEILQSVSMPTGM